MYAAIVQPKIIIIIIIKNVLTKVTLSQKAAGALYNTILRLDHVNMLKVSTFRSFLLFVCFGSTSHRKL